MEHGLLTDVALLDFSADFDLVDHNLLIRKLKSCNLLIVLSTGLSHTA